MKRIVCVLLVCAAISCKKEVEQNANSKQLSSASDLAAQQVLLNGKTNYGCLINGNFSPDGRAEQAQKLNVGYVRDAIIMDGWKGKSNNYDAYTNHGIKVVLNINYKQSGGTPLAFPTNMTTYKQKFQDIINTYQPPVVVVENEEINKNYHKGPITNYIAMLKVAINVCHAKNIKVTNGGIYGSALEISTYRYLQTKSQKRADSFGNNCMEQFQIKAAQNPGSNQNLEEGVRQLDTLLNFYKNLDYVNVHLYEPFNPNISNTQKVTTATPVVIPDIQEFLKWRTGRPTITNETGQRDNTSPDLVTSMLQEYDQLKFPYMIWYSGEGGRGAEPLYDINTGALYANGKAFSNYNASY